MGHVVREREGNKVRDHVTWHEELHVLKYVITPGGILRRHVAGPRTYVPFVFLDLQLLNCCPNATALEKGTTRTSVRWHPEVNLQMTSSIAVQIADFL